MDTDEREQYRDEVRPLLRRLSTTKDRPMRRRSTKEGPDGSLRLSVVSVTSGRGLQQRNSRSREHLVPNGVDKNTLQFVYSDEVERAIRYNYNSSAYPPLSRSSVVRTTKDPSVIIERLPNLYSDLVSFRRSRRFNLAREASWRAKSSLRFQLGQSSPRDIAGFQTPRASLPGGIRLPRLSMKVQQAAGDVFAKLREYRGLAADQDEALVAISPKLRSPGYGAGVTSPKSPAAPKTNVPERSVFENNPQQKDNFLPQLVEERSFEVDNDHISKVHAANNQGIQDAGKLRRKARVAAPTPTVVIDEVISSDIEE